MDEVGRGTYLVESPKTRNLKLSEASPVTCAQFFLPFSFIHLQREKREKAIRKINRNP